MNRRAWWATAQELQKSQVQLETKEQTTATIILLNNTNYAFENYDTH